MGLNRYTLYARFFPSIISALPLFVLAFFLREDVDLNELGKFLLSLKFYGGITLGIVGLYFYAQIVRFAAKLFESSYFAKGLGFPTTYLMTYADQTYSKSYKDKYRAMVKHDFNMDLLDEPAEATDPDEARKRLREVTKQVILKVKSGQLVLKHNIWYGFVRNLIGGALFSMAFCAVNLLIGVVAIKSRCLIAVSLVLIILYAFLLLFWKALMKQNAEAYAKQLIAEYISLSR
jgi:hypothetical protein